MQSKPVFIRLTKGANHTVDIYLNHLVSKEPHNAGSLVCTNHANPNLSVVYVLETPEQIDSLISEAVAGANRIEITGQAA